MRDIGETTKHRKLKYWTLMSMYLTKRNFSGTYGIFGTNQSCHQSSDTQEKWLSRISNGNQKSKNGRLKKTKIRNLLERLKKTKTEVLLFLHDSQVPYTNNLVERDLRPTKVQQKIFGCYRTKKGAEDYCAIKGYLSTVAKNGKNIFEACNKLARGEVFSLDEILTH